MISLSAMEEAGYRLIRKAVGERVTPDESHLLEVGSGDCSLLRDLVRKYQVRGVGIDPWTAERDEENWQCRQLAAEQVDVLDGRFSPIFSVMSLHHFRDVKQFFRKALQIAGWQGELVLVDWKSGTDTGIPERYFSLEEIKMLLEHTGWTIQKSEEHPYHFLIVARPGIQKIAVATSDGKTVFRGMLGQAKFFHIYQIDSTGEYHLVEQRENPYARTLQHLKTLDVYRVIRDCPLFVSYRIGRKGQLRLHARGIRMIFDEGDISDVLERHFAHSLEK